MAASITVYANPQAQSQDLPQPPIDRLAFRSLGASGDGLTRLGQGLQAAGKDEQDIALDQLATINEATVKQAHAQLTAALDTTLHDPDSGYLTKIGEPAVTGFGDTKKAINSAVEAAGSALTNPAQQRMFQAAAAQTAQTALTQAEVHAGQQIKQFHFDTSASRATAASGMAVRSYNPVDGSDNSAYAEALKTQAIELDTQAGIKGLADDARIEYIKAGLAKTYVDTVNHLVSNDQVKGAKKYFDSIQSLIPVEVRDKVNTLLNAGQDKDESLSVALTAQKQGGTLKQMEGRLNDQFSSGSITTAVHDMALQRLRADDAQRRSELNEQDKAIEGSVWDAVRQNPKMTVNNLPAATIAYVRERGLGPRIDAIFNHNDSTDNPGLFLKIMDQSFEDPAGFKNGGVAQYQGQLSKTNFAQLQARYLAIDKGDAQAQQVQKIQDAAVKAVLPLLAASGKDPKKNPDEYSKFEAELHSTLFLENQQRLAKKQNPLTVEEARDKITGLLAVKALSGTGVLFDTRGPVYTLPASMSEGDRSRAVQGLTAAGRPVTAENIVRYHNTAKALPAAKSPAPAKPSSPSPWAAPAPGVNANQD